MTLIQAYDDRLLSYAYTLGTEKLLIVANITDADQRSIIPLPSDWRVAGSGSLDFQEQIFSDADYRYSMSQIRAQGGLYVELGPNQSHVFRVSEQGVPFHELVHSARVLLSAA